MVLEKETMQRTLETKTDLNCTGRHFMVSSEILESYSKMYRYEDLDIRLLKFAQGSLGTLSDTFILYAVAMLGVADRCSIQQFLAAMKRKAVELSVYDPNDVDGLRKRLKALTENGFLFRHSFNVDAVNRATGQPSTETVMLYTIEKSGQSFMNQKLGYRTKVNECIQAKPLEELVGWASASYVATTVAGNQSFSTFKQGVFRSKALGTVFMPCETKMTVNGANMYIAYLPSFLHWNKSRQTEELYTDDCLAKITLIRDYFFYRANKSQDPYMVVVVENATDMNAFKDLIIKTEELLKYSDRIYFTGEGVIKRGRNIMNCFLQMLKTENGYELISSQPCFLS